MGHPQQQSVIEWKWYICICTSAGPEGISKLQKEIAHRHVVSTQVKMLFTTTHAPIDSWGVSYDQQIEEEKARSWLTSGSACQKVDSSNIIIPFWDNTERHK